MKITCIIIASVLLYIQLVRCGEDGCPDIGCVAVEYPPSCRVTVFSVENGIVCQLCDDCIKKTNVKDDEGCPIRACPAVEIPDNCERRRYFTYNGRICEDCPQNTCTY